MASEQVESRHARPLAAANDRNAIAAVRDAFVAADNAGAAEAMTRLPADILHPSCGVIDGKIAVRASIHRVLRDVRTEFGREATYSTCEVKVSGNLAYERGALRQRLAPKSGGAVEREKGVYLWIYARRDGIRQIARIAGTFTPADESAGEEIAGEC